MFQESTIAATAHVIQLAVAPVFLLSGIGSMLAVMTSRLSRVIDRARALEENLDENPLLVEHTRDELEVLSRRAKLIGRSIGLCTLTALLVCAVIAILFLGSFSSFDVAVVVSSLFVAAMMTFFVSLLFFLREVFLATGSLRIGYRKH